MGRTNSAVGAALLAAVCFGSAGAQDDPQLEELRKAEAKRIREREPLTRLEQELYTRPADLPRWAPSMRAEKIRARVVPIGFRDRVPPGPAAAIKGLREYIARNSGGALKLELEEHEAIRLDRDLAEVLSLPKSSTHEADLVGRILRDAAIDVSKVDAVVLLYAGTRTRNRGSVLWPHQASLRFGEKTVGYTLVPAEGDDASAIQAHEFLHLFGLGDKTGSSKHCILAFGYEPLEACGACRALLGWTPVGNVNPAKPSKVSVGELSEGGGVLRVEVSGDAEALLIELREGMLLVWHDLRGQLEFVAALDGKTSDRLSAHTMPGFRGKSRGADLVFLTDLFVDAEAKRACFRVSTREELTPLEKYNVSKTGRSLGR